MPFTTNPATEALANTLASLRGLTPDEAIAQALRAELDREAPGKREATIAEPEVEEILAKITALGRWRGPKSAQLTAELYGKDGLPR